jgi:hypothetical protein
VPEALHLRYGNRGEAARKTVKVEEAWRRKTDLRGLEGNRSEKTEGKERARKWTKELDKDINSRRSMARELTPEAQVALIPRPHPRRCVVGAPRVVLTPLPHPRDTPPPLPPQLARGAAGGQLLTSMQPATMAGGSRTVVKKSRDSGLEHVKKALSTKGNPLTRLEIEFVRTSCHILGINIETTMKVILKRAKERGEASQGG